MALPDRARTPSGLAVITVVLVFDRDAIDTERTWVQWRRDEAALSASAQRGRVRGWEPAPT